ncbi:MAG: GLPGLI family protein [Bacteroidota bacterium]
MKQLIIFLVLLLPALFWAQKEGEITFEETTKLEIQLPEGLPISKAQLEKMMPSETKQLYTLLFNNEASVYQVITNEPNEEQANQMGEDGSAIQVKMIRAINENITYHDIKNKSTTMQQGFMGKTFLIQDEAKKYAWKLSNESKEIAGYTCQKATLEEEDRKVEAWFTTAIPIASGPSNFYGLPGVILGLHIKGENSERWLTATEVELKKLEKDALIAPTKGKKVNRDQYNKIVEEKMKEMEEQAGGGGTVIRVRRQE